MTPTDTDLLLAAIRSQLARVHTSLPGVVSSYDAVTQTATVTPAVRFRHRLEDGTTEAYEPPPISNVPVAFPGGDGWSITWPLKRGDSVTLIFAERSLDEWRATKGASHEARDVRRFDLSDATAIPGGRSPADPLPAEAVDAAALVIRGETIKLGSATAADFVALASKVDAALDALAQAIDAWTPAPNDGGAVLKGLLTALRETGWPQATGAAKVKAE